MLSQCNIDSLYIDIKQLSKSFFHEIMYYEILQLRSLSTVSNCKEPFDSFLAKKNKC